MIFCFANLRPGRRWREGFWLECESQGLSAVIRIEGPNVEENELQIDVYAQKEEFEAWILLQPLCQQLTEINNLLSLKTEDFILAENNDEEKWFSLDSVWHWKRQGELNLQGERNLFPIKPLMDLIYGRYLSNVEKKLMEKQDRYRMTPQNVMAEIADLGADLSRPLDELTMELKRSNDLREQEIWALEKHSIIVEKNTETVHENTEISRENLQVQQQLNKLLCAVRDGKVQLPPEIINALAKAFRQSDEPALQTAGQKMKWQFWKDKAQLLRNLLGDTANFATIVPILVTLWKDYGPILLKLIETTTLTLM